MVKVNKFSITIVICITLILLAAIGGWVYVQQQQVAQKDRELQQRKELAEFEQEQINERAKKERQCEQAKERNSNPFTGGLSCR